MNIPSLEDWIDSSEANAQPLAGVRVLVRSDLNVPLQGGRIADDTRIRASTGTLKKLRQAGARVIVSSHLGRPNGQSDPSLSLALLRDALSDQIQTPVAFSEDCVGPETRSKVASLRDGQVLLLENLRFHRGETENQPAFAAQLAQLADRYVNDAFGTAHRAHASTTGVVPLMAQSAAGDLLQREVKQLAAVLQPARPLLCLLGGAKVSDKLGVLKALAERADLLAIGGAMAYTFLSARGEPTGASRVEPDRIEAARAVEKAAAESGCRLLLPSDHVVAESMDTNAPTRIVEQIPDGWMGLDIGPQTAQGYAREANNAQTIFWNGPMGVFEMDAFASGTESVAGGVAESHAFSVVGGGDSLAAINRLNLGSAISHLSTGGGASLEFIQGLTLPGLAALES
ncbi:MAG: phosphoglycerate kinase [Myxococcota bacterium]|nr:phosphoglycerate kinase [Myxococcota bacterium]